MKRRNFIQTGLAASLPLAGVAAPDRPAPRPKNKILNAYYLRAHMYTLVPRHVREDLKWMADQGTTAVSVAILEQDLNSAVENVRIIGQEAEKVGLSLFIVPSRWGGLLAGAPKVPSVFSVRNPQAYALYGDGKPSFNGISGVISSIHYPETYDFFVQSLDKAFSLWNLKGVIWDEPKSFFKDYSPRAKENLGDRIESLEAHAEAVAGFYSRLNRHLKGKYPQVSTHMFVYAQTEDMILQKCARIEGLDYFGCDGRPWSAKDGGVLEGEGKTLVDNASRYLQLVKSHAKKSLFLIENHNMQARDTSLMDRHLPELLAHNIDHLIYYYYPRNVENPDENMAVIAKHIRSFG
jgi:hypothetical protein